MIEKIIVVAPTTAVPISTGLAVALNVLPAPSFSSRIVLALVEVGLKPKSRSISGRDAGIVSIMRQLEDALRVVGDRAVGVDRDRHRAHAEEAERDQAEREHRRGASMSVRRARARACYEVRDAIRPTIVMPIQKAEKLPATRPERMLSDAPPSARR